MARRRLLAAIEPAIFWLGLIVVGGLALYGTRPPAAVNASAPLNVFSAARAITHLAEIAKRPHPIGSDEAVRVRDYLVATLTELGGETHVDQGIGSVHYARNIHAGLVNNIVATFRGTSNNRAILLAAHYDSVPEGPGAADDGAGIVTLLEVVRALRAGPPMKNDLIVLFTDGEEARGLLGAQAFTTSHPDLADKIGLVVNLEARGSSGPGLMFETSNENGALIREFARSTPYPMATSLMAAIYRLLPNDTDFTIFKAAGVTGLNFAFLETYEGYHTRLDMVENLDPRSVQHLGANVLGIARHFGNLAEPAKKAPDLVYFNWFGSRLWIYPVWLAWIVALLTPILFGCACVRLGPVSGLTFQGVIAGFGGFFLQILVMIAASFAAFALARLLVGEFLEGDTFSNQLLFAGVMAIAFGLATGSQQILARKLGLINLAAGQLFALYLLTIILCWFLIGGSYVLQWPLVFAMLGMVLAFRVPERIRSFCLFAFLVPALLILVPLIYMFFVALTFTYFAVAAAALLLSALLAMAVALFDRLTRTLTVTLTVILLPSVLLIAVGAHLTARSSKHPRRNSLIYGVNADENKAKWVSYDDAPDSWTASVLGSTVRRQADAAYAAGLERPVLSSDATLTSLTPPSAVVSADTAADGLRILKLRVSSTRGARSLLVRLSGELKLQAAGWNDHVESLEHDSKIKGPWTLRFYNLPPEGVSLELRFSAPKPIQLWLADSTPGLPSIQPLSPRPDDTTPAYGSDLTLVERVYEF